MLQSFGELVKCFNILEQQFNKLIEENKAVERWKNVPSFQNYKVSTLGRVMNVKRGRILRPILQSEGYQQVILSNDNIKKHFLIHRLIANAFIDNPDNKLFVDHIDGNKKNNHVNNLRFATRSENCRNTKIRCDNKTGYKGVTHLNKSFVARIRYNGKNMYIGYFKCPIKASKAYERHALALFGEFYKKTY